MKQATLAALVLATMSGVSAQSPLSYKDWTYRGCFADNPTARALHHGVGSSSSMTVQFCLDQCDSLGFGFAGVEYNRECYCGNTLLYGYGSSEACASTCTGDATQICGGPNALTVYGNGKLPLTTGPSSIIPNYKNWIFTQCWQDDKWTFGGKRLLPHWPDEHIPVEEMTVEGCLDGCEASGYTSAGVEYGQECWCGNITYPPGQSTSRQECNMPCTMNAGESCGGPLRIVIYAIPPLISNY